MSIPTIDISGFTSDDPTLRHQVVAEWREALDAIGFVLISGHGIPETLTAGLYDAALGFFEKPEEQKLAVATERSETGPAGYVRLFGETVGKTREGLGISDISESLTFISPAAGLVPSAGKIEPGNKWPLTAPDLRTAVESYAAHAYRLGRRLMRLSALALDLPEDYFEACYSPMDHTLRLAFYPDQDVEPKPGQLRNAPHTDFAGFTILRQDQAPGGLQVLAGDGDWIDVPPVPGALVINSGDLIQRWTNDRWISNVHRVVNPPRSHKGTAKRLSIVFFTGPRMDAEIACLPHCSSADHPARYPPIIAGEHVAPKLAQTYGGAGPQRSP